MSKKKRPKKDEAAQVAEGKPVEELIGGPEEERVDVAAKKMPADDTTPLWESAITKEGWEDPNQLLANPWNWRVHPERQQRALADVMGRVGWVQRVIVNERTGHMVDGHLRVTLALRKGEPKVPVTYIDVSEDDERLILQTFDTITGQAIPDRDVLIRLVEQSPIPADLEAAQALIDDIMATIKHKKVEAPKEFPEYGDGIKTDFRCPKCGHEWSGKKK